MAQSFYCRTCEVLIDASEVDSEVVMLDDTIELDRYFYHTLIVTLTVGGETKSITHPVVPE